MMTAIQQGTHQILKNKDILNKMNGRKKRIDISHTETTQSKD